jgi:divalent metal cation (Fe/Co/Zn/Cd) transporter
MALPDTYDHATRRPELSRAWRLEILTVGWNVAEAVIAITAALAAGSVALLGFGIDSVVESASGAILLWRLGTERRAARAGNVDLAAVERLDQRAHRLVGVSLFLLAAFVAVDAVRTLVAQERPEPSLVGIVLTAVSLVVMAWLARAKRRSAARLESRSLAADAFQTTACWWLSLITLVGIGANALFGWWWADPLAALAFTPLLIQEGREGWRGEDCGCHD